MITAAIIIALIFLAFRYLPRPAKDVESAQARLDKIIWQISAIKHAIDYKEFAQYTFDSLDRSPTRAIPDLAPFLSSHFSYIIRRYHKISRFSVSVRRIPFAGLNLPFLPGVILSTEAFNYSDPVTLKLLAHEAYHDFFLGHSRGIPLYPGAIPLDLLYGYDQTLDRVYDWLNSFVLPNSRTVYQEIFK